jgi:isoquinoline 1-oxidoreductase beta subunit
MSRFVSVSRRDFLRAVPAAGAGLVIGFRLLDGDAAAAAEPVSAKQGAARFAPNAFLQIDTDGVVTLWTTKSEMGQGVRTALPMILAEEIGADFSKVKVEQAWLDRRFPNLDTGGSSSVRESWDLLRQAGAAARALLVGVAARRFGVEPTGCVAENGEVVHGATGRRAPFGTLVAEASQLPIPKDPPLKDPRTYTLLGRAVPRTDTPSKVDGSAVYGIDVRRPGMLYAAVVLEPTFGARPGPVDDAAARKVPGVKRVVPFRRGVAVLADSTWAAFKGRDALKVAWKEDRMAAESSASLRERCLALAKQSGKVLRSDGDVAAALTGATRRVEATYELPFQAHAALEPVNATAHVTSDRCEIWAPTQTPSWAMGELKRALGLPAEAIRINVTLLGGGFGRRINPDFIVDAAEISKAAGAPVQMVWSREQDLQHDYYRPFSLHLMQGGLDAAGRPVAWSHRYVSTSIGAFYNPDTKEPESDELGGAADLPFAIPHVQVEYSPVESRVPRGWWRSVDNSINAFVVESFLDEMASAVGQDPLRLRQELLRPPRRISYPTPDLVQDTARLKGVIDLVAEKTPWGTPLGKGQGRGIAAQFSFRSYCAMAAEVEVSDEGALSVRRIVAAIDCGRVVHPGLVAAQMESAVAFGLTAALKSEITIEAGRVAQSNFNDYEILRIDEMPQVETYIVPSSEPPTGVGEPGVPVVAPAVFNAVFAATGRRIRRLPPPADALKRG